MSIWNKVLLWLIGLASIGFLILAARSLRTHSGWLAEAQSLQKQIGDEGSQTGLKWQNHQLRKEIADNRLELYRLLVDRPQVWANCRTQVNKQTGAVMAAIDVPIPHGISADSPLYAFEEPTAESPGRYLGEFNVVKAEEKQILLQPAYPLSPLNAKKLSETRGPWSFYNVLPQDNHESLAQLTDAQKKAVLPPDTVDEYLKDGKPATEQDPKERIDPEKRYVRQLRDYAQLFAHSRRQLTVLFDEAEATKRDKALVEESLADAQRQVQFSQNLITELNSQLTKKLREVDAVANLRKLIDEKLKSIEGMVGGLIEKNKAMAGQIAEKQLEATRLIDSRIRTMAQAASEKK